MYFAKMLINVISWLFTFWNFFVNGLLKKFKSEIFFWKLQYILLVRGQINVKSYVNKRGKSQVGAAREVKNIHTSSFVFEKSFYNLNAGLKNQNGRKIPFNYLK